MYFGTDSYKKGECKNSTLILLRQETACALEKNIYMFIFLTFHEKF